jgi:hypothetical protein
MLIMEGIQLSSVKKRMRYYQQIVGNSSMENKASLQA